MTVSSSARRAGPFIGNGVTNTFPFTFKVFATSDIAVYITDLSGVQAPLLSGLVTLNPDQDASPGGTVTTSLATGFTLDIVGAVDYTQGTDLTNLGRFLPDVIEKAFDRLTILAQQLREWLGRTVSFPVGDNASPTLPSAAARANKALVFDGSGNVTVGTRENLNAIDASVAAAVSSAAGAAGSAAAALVSQNAAAASATDAQASKVSASAFATIAQSARDAALIQAGVYATEAAGRAAVADGVAFKVQGSGDIAAYEYRRVNSGSSTLIATYPSSATGAIKYRSTSFISPGKNLFNPTDPDFLAGFFVNYTTGATNANAAFYATGFIPVVGGSSYAISNKHQIAWYDAAKVYILGSSNTDTNQIQVAPAAAAYLRCTINGAGALAVFQVELGAAVTAYKPFELNLAAPGGSPINAAARAGSLLTPAYAPQSVTVDKTAFVKTGKNLFNQADPDFTAGYYVVSGDGTLAATATYNASGYIPVVAGATYTVSATNYYAWYDAAKTYLSGGGSGGPPGAASQLIAPAGAAYLRITVQDGPLPTFQVEAGSAQTTYEAYSLTLLGPGNVPVLASSNIAAGAITPEKTSFVVKGKNLFSAADPDFLSGYYVPYSTGVPATTAGFYATGFIPVVAGSSYAISNKHQIAWYTAAKTYISGSPATDANQVQVAPAGAAYLRCSINGDVALASFQVELGAAVTAYEEFVYRIGTPLNESVVLTTRWKGKTWATLGDSITAQGLWQPAVVGKLGLTWANFGSTGTAIAGAGATAMCNDARINAIPANTDLVTVLGGTNDWAQNVPLGAAASTNVAEFYGALNVMLGKLMARFPAKRIALAATTYGELYSLSHGGPNAWTNSLGLTTNDYAEAVRVACKRWGVPCIDLAGNCGWNTSNIRTYIGDDGGLLHPNTVGARRVSEVVLGTLRAIAPLA